MLKNMIIFTAAIPIITSCGISPGIQERRFSEASERDVCYAMTHPESYYPIKVQADAARKAASNRGIQCDLEVYRKIHEIDGNYGQEIKRRATERKMQDELASSDDAQCRSYGATPGSDAYINCRVALEAQRRQSSEISSSADQIRRNQVFNTFFGSPIRNPVGGGPLLR